MSTVKNAVALLSESINIQTGLSHPNDKEKAKEVFLHLHKSGVVILKNEVEHYAMEFKWSERDADELASLAQQVGEGKKISVKGGPWFSAVAYSKMMNKD